MSKLSVIPALVPCKTERLSYVFSVFFCLIAFLVLCPWVLSAQLEKDIEKLKRCISKRNEMTAAMVARDWQNLERLGNEYLLVCKGGTDPEDLSVAYAHIAIANNRLEKYRSALTAAESCIKAYYANPGCHIEKSEALIALGRKSEAWKSLEISEKLARHALDTAKQELNDARSELDRKNQTSKIDLYNTQLLLIESIRSELAR
jgi:tetratricopeptide (TPR) repeat protein